MALRERLAQSLGEGMGRHLVFLAIAAMVLFTSFYPPIGTGILVAFVLVVGINFMRNGGMEGLGLSLPTNFKKTLMWGVVWGFAFQSFDVLFLTPGIEEMTGVDTDYSKFVHIEGNLSALAIMLAFVWIVVVLVEEVVFRRYFFEELSSRIGDKGGLPIISIALSTVFFGLAHWYQGISGVITTGLIGAFMLVLYLKSGRNLWMPMIAHGTINTIGLAFFYFGLYHVDDLVWGLSHLTER